MGSGLLVGALSFLGAAFGAAISYWGAHVAARQRDQQSRREEWGRRFTSALADVGAEDPRRQALGSALLARLAKSDLASQEERDLADHLLLDAARQSEQGTPLDAAIGDADADGISLVMDSPRDDTGEDRR